VTVPRSELRSKSEVLSTDLAGTVAEAALEKKATDIRIMDLRGLTTMTDFFVIATISTEVHSRAVEGAISERTRERYDTRPWHVEGGDGGRTWVLLDYVDVVVHLFNAETREFYSLERLWGDAPTEAVSDPADETARPGGSAASGQGEGSPERDEGIGEAPSP